MPIQSVSFNNNVNFKGNKNNISSVKASTDETKNKKKKLVLALGGLAIMGIVTAGIIYKARKGKNLNLKPNQKALETFQDIQEFDKQNGITRLKTGIGLQTDTIHQNGEKWNWRTLFKPNSKEQILEIEIHESKKEKIVSTYRILPNPAYSKVVMEKDENGNIIKVINNKYNDNSISNGGYGKITEIKRDKAGKVIDYKAQLIEF